MTAWINEFHYDNVGTDTGEFIEIAGRAGTDLGEWSLVRYNGSNPAAAVVYTSPGSITLTGVIPNQQNGFGTLSFALPQDGLQNGPNDGFALLNGATLVQLLSYEGIFTALSGPAAGQTSTDVGVAQTSTTPVGASLHLVGAGDASADFRWEAAAVNSAGAVNAGQVFMAPMVVPKINEFVFNHVGTDTNEYVEVLAGPGADLSAYTLIGIEGDFSGTATGTVDNVFALTTADAAGFWTTGFLANALENGTLTLLLVEGFSGSLGDDLDTNDDGVLDITPWTAIVDAVAVTDGGANDRTYAGAAVLAPGFDGVAFTPGGASRIPDATDTDTAADWVRNDFDLAGIPGFTGTPVVGEALNTPGAPNQAYVPPAGATVSIDDVSVAEGDAGTTLLTFTVTRSDDAGAFTVDFATSDGSATAGSDYVAAGGTLSFAAGGALTQTIAVTVNGDTTVEPDETFTVTLSNLMNAFGAATIADASGTGTILNDDAALTRIHAVQGAGAVSPLVGQTVTVEAIVVGDFQNGDADARRNLQGFYLQEEDADADNDPLTSEGIFVFQGSSVLGDVDLGDRVRVTGTVSEFFGMTQISAASITVLDSNVPLPTAAEILLPATGTTLSQNDRVQPDLEAYEGMRVVLTQTLTVTEQFQLGRFNEIKLVAGDRPMQFTQENAPSVAGNQAALIEVGARTITYDDGQNIQNGTIGNLDGFGPVYATANAPRMGDTVTGLTGVLDYQWAGHATSGATWRLRSTEDGANNFETANARPAAPPDVGGTLTVAAFNVLNFFTTLDIVGATTALGLDPRGADNAEEFERQAEKLLTTLDLLGADVIGLIELENDFLPGSPGNAIEFIVAGLNGFGDPDAWSWVNPDTQFVGDDAIAVGLIYRNDAVQIADGTTVAFLDTGLIAESGRAPIAASFEHLDSGEVFTVVVNHFKSKSSPATLAGDADQGDGQGFSNATRVQQAQELLDWLATDPTGANDPDVLITGDLNAYAMEDPITLLKNAGFVNLEPPGDYSFVFNGLTGSLDHSLASASLAAKVAGAAAWHINADEASALDYNLDFGRDPAIFDGTVPYRSSDHDPLLVGFDFVAPPAAATLTFDIYRIGTAAGDRTGWGGQVTEITWRDDTTGGANVTDTRDADAPLAPDGITISAEDGDFAIHGVKFSDNMGNRRAGVDPLLTVEWDATGQEASIELLRNWNSWKNLAVDSFDGTALTVTNFVHVFVDLRDAASDLEIALNGAKRADVRTGGGDDEILIGIDSNAGARNLITVDAGAGDDVVRLGAADRAYAEPVFGLSQFDSRAVTHVVLGAGDDTLYGTGSDRDMAIYADSLADVAFMAIAGGVRVTTATEGTDELYDVEFVQLAGIRYALDALI